MAKTGKDDKHQSELKRRVGQTVSAKLEAREAMLSELSDPERFAHHLRVFSHLALLLPTMHPCRFPPDAFVDGVIAAPVAEVPEGENAAVVRGTALRASVIPTLAGEELLTRCQEAIQTTIDSIDDRDQLMALTAAGALASSCEQGGTPKEHAFWDILFEVTFTECLLSSLFLIRLVHSHLVIDEESVAQVFAKELSQGELGAELGELGLNDPDPTRMATSYAALVADRDPHHFQYDAVLNLSALHVELAQSLGKHIAMHGLTPDLLDDVRTRVQTAFDADVSHGLIDEISAWYRKHLETMRDSPETYEGKLPHSIEVEIDRCLTSYLAFKALPLGENPLLHAIHVQSLARSRVGVAPDEAPFVARLWSNPTDCFALEEFEKYLLARNDKSRSRRVRRFREATHKAQQAANHAKPADPENSAEAPTAEEEKSEP